MDLCPKSELFHVSLITILITAFCSRILLKEYSIIVGYMKINHTLCIQNKFLYNVSFVISKTPKQLENDRINMKEA